MGARRGGAARDREVSVEGGELIVWSFSTILRFDADTGASTGTHEFESAPLGFGMDCRRP